MNHLPHKSAKSSLVCTHQNSKVQTVVQNVLNSGLHNPNHRALFKDDIKLTIALPWKEETKEVPPIAADLPVVNHVDNSFSLTTIKKDKEEEITRKKELKSLKKKFRSKRGIWRKLDMSRIKRSKRRAWRKLNTSRIIRNKRRTWRKLNTSRIK